MNITVLFIATTIQLHLPPGLLSAVCYIETKHQPNRIHYNDGGANSVGICQIKLASARQVGYKGTELGLLNPKINILYAGKFLKYQLKRYRGSVTKAVIAYNKGHADTESTAYQLKVFEKWRIAENE